MTTIDDAPLSAVRSAGRTPFLHGDLRCSAIGSATGRPSFGGMLTHFKCLRRRTDDRGWIRKLMEEAANERMRLMTFVEIAKPNVFERMVIRLAHGTFILGCFRLYLVSARTAGKPVDERANAPCPAHADEIRLLA